MTERESAWNTPDSQLKLLKDLSWYYREEREERGGHRRRWWVATAAAAAAAVAPAVSGERELYYSLSLAASRAQLYR